MVLTESDIWMLGGGLSTTELPLLDGGILWLDVHDLFVFGTSGVWQVC